MAAVADRIRHEISRQVGVKGIHRYLVGGDGAEPNKAVQPHEDGIAPLRSLLSRQSPGLSNADLRRRRPWLGADSWYSSSGVPSLRSPAAIISST